MAKPLATVAGIAGDGGSGRVVELAGAISDQRLVDLRRIHLPVCFSGFGVDQPPRRAASGATGGVAGFCAGGVRFGVAGAGAHRGGFRLGFSLFAVAGHFDFQSVAPTKLVAGAVVRVGIGIGARYDDLFQLRFRRDGHALAVAGLGRPVAQVDDGGVFADAVPAVAAGGARHARRYDSRYALIL